MPPNVNPTEISYLYASLRCPKVRKFVSFENCHKCELFAGVKVFEEQHSIAVLCIKEAENGKV